ncbi:hypothetical protein [Sphingobium lignivorans]|uniref:Uncharacterized protein n=1 Tax=Sphingobium lignivorans TaxID=2735886 RepID=A0ABR6NHB9_9SPHN|nr:hypothetical protein [Sphingobium lignivorans]MBB5986668.1 hypothetical protein [Sphingobium lignivorans]
MPTRQGGNSPKNFKASAQQLGALDNLTAIIAQLSYACAEFIHSINSYVANAIFGMSNNEIMIDMPLEVKMIRLASFVMVIMGLCTATSGVASTSAQGYVLAITQIRQGPFIFSQNGTRTAQPSCSTLNRWAVDTSTDAGKAMVAIILSAYSMRKKVVIQGTGDCSTWFDSEAVDYLYIID